MKKPNLNQPLVAVKSACAPVLRLDGRVNAAYLQFVSRPVGEIRTIVIDDYPLLTVDLNEDGAVVGIEAVGFKDFSVATLLKKSGVQASAAVIAKTRYTLTDRKPALNKPDGKSLVAA